jgi:hypothetical protein
VDEDYWKATVTFRAYDPSNVRPSVSLSGPTTGAIGENLTYTADFSDPDGEITGVRYDLDGDGTYETDGQGARFATTSFNSPGLRTVGVQVSDNEGGVARASADVRITSAQASGTAQGVALLSSFKLGRPVFGGVRNNRLTIRYRLRERATVIVSLYRGSKRVARLSRGRRIPNRTYRINVSPRRLRRAGYTVRIFVRSADGRRVQAARLSAKRL